MRALVLPQISTVIRRGRRVDEPVREQRCGNSSCLAWYQRERTDVARNMIQNDTVKLSDPARNWANPNFSCGSDLDDIAPRIHSGSSEFTRVCGCQFVARQVEQDRDRVVDGNKTLLVPS